MLHPSEETSIRLTGDWSSPEADRISTAWFDAIGMFHKLPDSVRYMQGMSGKKYRYFINNLVGETPDARYLEIGSWAGSTACSAMYGNKCKITCIDNWSEEGGPKDKFMANTSAVRTDDIDFTFIESDFRNVDYSNIGKFNIYMFDGPHSEQDQYDGIAIAQPALDDMYVLIVDDYNGYQVQSGTQKAFDNLGLNVIAKMEIITVTEDNVHPILCHQHSDWHNGYLIALVSKK